MKKKQNVAAARTDFARTLGAAVRVGQVLAVNHDGTLLVNFPGNPGPPVTARMLASALNGISAQSASGRQALLVFENGDALQPIVVGLLADVDTSASNDAVSRDYFGNVKVNGKQLRFDGSESVAIVCGKSSIVMHADGRVVVKGTRLTSRASEANKIKGATIDLN